MLAIARDPLNAGLNQPTISPTHYIKAALPVVLRDPYDQHLYWAVFTIIMVFTCSHDPIVCSCVMDGGAALAH